jgi:hypothetical protein
LRLGGSRPPQKPEFIGPRHGGLDRDRSKWMSEPETVISSTTSSGRSTIPSLSTIAVAE